MKKLALVAFLVSIGLAIVAAIVHGLIEEERWWREQERRLPNVDPDAADWGGWS